MEIKDILEKVKNQEIDINEALDLLQHQEDYACIDYDRQKRTGVPEIIYGAGKTKEQIAGIISQMLKHNQQNILATKVNLEKYDYLKEQFPNFQYDQLSQTFVYNGQPFSMNKGLIAVVCAGTSQFHGIP